MKPFLGIDITNDKKNEQHNGIEFLVQKPSEALSKSLKVSTDNAEETIEKSKLPTPFRIAQYICGFAAIVVAGGTLKSDVSLAQGYRNAPELYWIGGICAVLWSILWLIGKQKSKTVLDTDESAHTFSRLDSVAAAVYQELGVPNDAKSADILFFYYKIKDGEIKPKEKALTTHFNPEFKLFNDNENLYLVNLEGKYAFPLASITAFRTVKKHIRIVSWNKEESFKKGIYKQYKLTTDSYGNVHCKYYHILEVTHQGEVHGIHIPCYDLPIFEECTGLKAQAE